MAATVLTLHPGRLAARTLPLGTGWLLGDCMEARGKQELWLRQKPEVLAALREQSLIQSVESSNRIEGVSVPAHRLRPLVVARARPRDRSEEELAGYRRALAWIFGRRGAVAITPSLMLRLHGFAQGGSSGDAGAWKRRDNEVLEVLPSGEPRVRFRPTSAKATPGAMSALCRNYGLALQDGRVPGLLLSATFVFDLLCIHPFRDGNGRVSRLVTTLLLLGDGFEVPRYVSLERLVEERKEEYYRVLADCSAGRHEGRNVIVPWWNFFLGVLRSAYKELEVEVESRHGYPAKSELVRRVVLAQAGEFTTGEVAAQCPGVSIQLVKKVLSGMKDEGTVHLTGRGRGARWRTHDSSACAVHAHPDPVDNDG